MASKTSLQYTHRSGYTKAHFILLADLCVGIVSAVITLLLHCYFSNIPYILGAILPTAVAAAMVSTLVSSMLLSAYRQIFRYSTTVRNMRLRWMTLLNAFLFSFQLMLYARYFLHTELELYKCAFFFFLFLTVFAILIYFQRIALVYLSQKFLLHKEAEEGAQSRIRVLVYGVSSTSAQLLQQLESGNRFQVIGVCDSTTEAEGYQLEGYPTYSIVSQEDLKRIAAELNCQGVVFSSRKDFLKSRDTLIFSCEKLGLPTYIANDISQSTPNQLASESVQRVQIEDLLMREEISYDKDQVRKEYKDRTILVTGAAGSIGSELVKQIAHYEVCRLVLVDNAETPLHNLRLYLEQEFPSLAFTPIIADVRDLHRLELIFSRFNPDIVLHAAAYKHVPLMEENPCEAICVNVIGSRHVADCCRKYGVAKMVMISTDKAVNPTNVMGATKRAAEIYVQSLGKAIEEGVLEGKTKYITTRFGNVLGSQGSVIHLFRDQIAKGGPVTVTDPDIVRYFMTIPEACSLVLEASSFGNSTQIFVFDMGDKHKIVDLAEHLIRLAGFVPGEDIQIKFTGLRPGEKLYEEVLANEENTIKTDLPKVRIAVVRNTDYKEMLEAYNQVCELGRAIKPTQAVKALKALIPEYISANSQYSVLDRTQ